MTLKEYYSKLKSLKLDIEKPKVFQDVDNYLSNLNALDVEYNTEEYEYIYSKVTDDYWVIVLRPPKPKDKLYDKDGLKYYNTIENYF